MEAIRPCPEEQEGFIRRKCEKTNNRTRGYWPSHSNPENCVQRVIFQTRDRVSKVSSEQNYNLNLEVVDLGCVASNLYMFHHFVQLQSQFCQTAQTELGR